MEVSNYALTALFDALRRTGHEPSSLLEGTKLSFEDLKRLRGKHSWKDFCIMFRNMVSRLGQEEASKQIAYTGVNNLDIGFLKRIGMVPLSPAFAFWFQAKFSGPFLFKNVEFKYHKITKNLYKMKVTISENSENLPELLHSYKNLFETFPLYVGYRTVDSDFYIEDRTATYLMEVRRSPSAKMFKTFFRNVFSGYRESIRVLHDLDLKNHEYELQERKLVKINLEKSKLVTVLTHDMNNSIQSMSLLMRKLHRLVENEECQKTAQKIENHLSTLENIIRDVNKEHSDEGSLPSLTQVSVDAAMQSVISLFQERLTDKNIRIEFINDLPSEISAIANQSTFENQVLSNILSNSIKFSQEGSIIFIKTYLKGSKILIELSDHGVGMSLEKRNSLFKNVKNKSTVGTNGETGLGYGMAIVFKYIESYNGEINVSNNEPRGTKFTITLNSYNELSDYRVVKKQATATPNWQ